MYNKSTNIEKDLEKSLHLPTFTHNAPQFDLQAQQNTGKCLFGSERIHYNKSTLKRQEKWYLRNTELIRRTFLAARSR